MKCIETLGFSGSIVSTGIVTGRLAEGGPDIVFFATDYGLYAVSNGMLNWWQQGGGYPALIEDITSDGSRDVVAYRGSCIRCYDGSNGNLEWQFQCGQRRVFENDLGWGNEDLNVAGIQVGEAQGFQVLAARSNRYVFGIDARNGQQLWRFRASDQVSAVAAVPDDQDNKIDDFVIGTYHGWLSRVDGRTGQAEWNRKVGEQWLRYESPSYGSVSSISNAGDQGNGVVISMGDGRVCMVDTSNGGLRWDNQLVDRDIYGDIEVWCQPDLTGDGLSDVVAILPNAKGSRTTPRDVVLLNGADGNQVSIGQAFYGASIGTMDGQPVMLEPHPQSGIRIVSLKDQSVVGSFKVQTLEGDTPQIKQMSDGNYLTFSDHSDLALITKDGTVQWVYPRTSSIVVKKGLFTPDDVPDLLLCSESTEPAGQVTSVRLMSIVDGAAYKVIWTYEVLCADFATRGGLGNVQVTPDLTGDGIQDVVARQGSIILRFSGADGAVAQFDVGENAKSLQTMSLNSETDILVETLNSLMILDKDGNKLWSSACSDWGSTELGAVRVLTNLNQDGSDGIVMSFIDRLITVNCSSASPLSLGISRIIAASDNQIIELNGLTNDIDNDGVQEIAYFEYDKDKSAETGTLIVVSPVSDRAWHRFDMPVTLDLACADFNSDGYQDSLVYGGYAALQTTPVSSTASGQDYAPVQLSVFSGKNDSVLWNHKFDADRWNPGSEKMPATPVGDLTGDGREELAVSSIVDLYMEGASVSETGPSGTTEAEFMHETVISVYDITSGILLKDITLPPAQKNSGVAWFERHRSFPEPAYGPGDFIRSVGDLNGDGYPDLAVLAGYLPPFYYGGLPSRYLSTSGHCLAVVDLDDERVLAYCGSESTLDFFESNSDRALGLSIGGSVCLTTVDGLLQVTSPSEGATVGSRIKIAWKGARDPSYSSIFVDGYENARTSGDEISLPVRPGEHEVIVRSIDEYGMVTYASVHFKAEQRVPWMSILASLSVVALLSLYFAPRTANFVRHRKARGEGL